MLSVEDNELLCTVEKGTPMGDLMREYWIPALKSTELASPDSPPVRVRLLGENLIAFRTTSGSIGMVANACPHRGASLFFGRNEEEGLRCVYHGWKFDTTGQCVDMPSEPAESNFKTKVRATSYPCLERKGVVWTYMGSRETPPSLPHIESNMIEGAENGNISKTMRDCNYMQALEGDIDTSHLAFLHQGALKWQDQPEGSQTYYVVKDRAPRYAVLDTDFGTAYGAQRPTDTEKIYWRLAYTLLPFYTMIPTDVLGEAVRIRAWVPIDSGHTMVWSMNAPRVPSATQAGWNGAAFGQGNPGQNGGGRGRTPAGPNGNDYLPETTDWLGKFRLVANKENDYLLDREAQKNWVSFTGINGGINGVFLEDQAVTESMGQIYERHHEHLGTSDQMVIRTRRRLLNAAKAYRNNGSLPEGVDNPNVYAVRSGGVLLDPGVDWWEGTKDLRKAFVRHTENGPVPMEVEGLKATV